MNDWLDADARLLYEVEPVVTAVAAIVPAGQIMLVGAQCRDLLDWRFECGPPLRRTNDTDIAIALRDWDQFERLRERFPAEGSSGHRFQIEGITTDVIPFGGVEAPKGTTSRPPGTHELNVHGFSDAFEKSDTLPVSNKLSIRIPTAAGYSVLKTHAWLDRSAWYDYKDGADLALAVHWYTADVDRLYAPANGWALHQYDHGHAEAAAALLGRDMRDSLSTEERLILRARIMDADRDLLAERFAVSRPGWPLTGRARRPLVDALFDQITPVVQ